MRQSCIFLVLLIFNGFAMAMRWIFTPFIALFLLFEQWG